MKDKERWLALCQQGAVSNTKKLIALVRRLIGSCRKKSSDLNQVEVHPHSADDKHGAGDLVVCYGFRNGFGSLRKPVQAEQQGSEAMAA